MKRYIGVALLLAGAACTAKKSDRPTIQTVAVQRRDIVIDAQATGIVEAINVVEVKSKASGMIVEMPVETGTIVRPGDLIVQIDTRDVKNQLDQAQADLDAALERQSVSEANKNLSDQMFEARVITAQENRQANLDLTNARTAVIRAKAAVDLAQQRFEDARITAPGAGIILEKTVAPGVVIASATGSVSGGTTLVKMADLSRVAVRARFNETDIGLIRAGQIATVSVDAYPDRPFTGAVEKIEPQAVIQQNVTMFPVLVTLDNREGLLKPGMNGEVSVRVDERQNVLSVPNDAVRNPRELNAMSGMLGISPESAQAMVNMGRGAMVASAPVSGAELQGTSSPDEPGGDATASTAQGGGRAAGRQGAGGGMARGGGGGAGQAGRGGQRAGGTGGRGAGALSVASEASAARSRARTGLIFVRDTLILDPAAPSDAGSGGLRLPFGNRDTVSAYRYIPRIVQLGASNYDFTEVLSGLREGDQVVLMGAVALAQARQAQIDFAKGRIGSPLNPTVAQPRGGGGGGGGGPRGGGGGGGGGGGRGG